MRTESLARKHDFAAGIEYQAAQAALPTGKEADHGRLPAFKRSSHGGEQSVRFGSVNGLEKQVDGAATAKPVGDVRGIVEVHRVAFHRGVFTRQPGRTADDLSLEATAADRTGMPFS